VILSLAASLYLSAATPSEPMDIRAVLVELTIDAERVTRACDTIESTGSRAIDAATCLLVAKTRIEIPEGALPEKGGASIKWKVHAAMVQFADGSSQLAIPPERMMRRAFLRTHPQGQRGVMLVEAMDKQHDTRTCAFFAPRTASRFDPAKCERVLSVEKQVTDSPAKGRRTLIWANAVVAAGDL
jgi:hypothetical protein